MKPTTLRDIDKTLQKILEIFANEILAYGRNGEPNNPKLFKDTEQTISAHYASLIEECLGEKEPETFFDPIEKGHYIDTKAKIRNALRDQIRANMKEKM